MEDHIEWVLEMNIQDGKGDAVQPLVEEMVAATRETEPGALTYEYYVNADKTRCTVLERYADNAAVMVHLGNFGEKFADRFFATFEAVRFTVYGPSNDEVRAALAGLGATFDARISGFHR
ncbi:putative quinol monooxygenase [Roseobacter sp. EG26]|uniref:putative quinol monooxygenase n=1 Tax=Roseobacter sp. EG26 TaxID=3412477 RepID=UPI0026131E4F|nr:antibiotic biosynthesis monooxygenase [uncultured Roseobacter sp.]